LTIQSKSNHNPLTIFGKRNGIANIKWPIYDKTMEFPRDISYQLTTLLLNYLPENLDKKYITSLLEHDAL
jgi:hypothetical protein